MEELLKKVSELIDKSNNIPNNIKPIVKAICKGYIRESNGKISLEGINNICNTTFIKIEENDQKFRGKKNIFGDAGSEYDKDCNVISTIQYLNNSNYIMLISTLTHEIGHILTNAKPLKVTENGIYPLIKRTITIHSRCEYKNNGDLLAAKSFGNKMTEGYIESMCTKIFDSQEFRKELYQIGYDLKDYKHKDERLFPSRIYDEYKACFELFDYIMDGSLSNFACTQFKSNQEILDYINKNRIITFYNYLDKSNELLWDLKDYEEKEYDEQFDELLNQYLKAKNTSLNLAKKCIEIYGKSSDDKELQKLYDEYAKTLSKQKLLPLPNEYLNKKQYKK